MFEKNNNLKPELAIRLLFFSLVLLTGFAIFSIFAASLQTPFYMSKTVKMNISYLLPQGWAFFTKDAREEKLLVFKRESNGSLIPVTSPGGSYLYDFGLNREGRKVSLEYSTILKSVDSLAWKNIDYDIKDIAVQSLKMPMIKAKNSGYKTKVCGEIVIVRTHTIPWAWSKFKSIKMPSKYVRLTVNCKN